MREAHQDIVVDEAPETKACISLQPRGDIAGKGYRRHRRLVRISKFDSVLNQNETRRGQGHSDEPRESFGIGGLPQRGGLKKNREERS